MKFLKKLVSAKVFLLLQFIASIVLTITVIRIKIMPMKYLIAMIAVLLIFLLITFLLQFRARETSARAMFSRILAAILCIVLIMGSVLVNSSFGYIENVANADYETNMMSVIVLKDSDYRSIDDLSGKTIGVNQNADEENMEKAISDIDGKIDVSYTSIDDFESLGDSLYDKKVDAILINNAYTTMIENKYEDFSEETTVVYHVALKTKTEDFANSGAVKDGVFNICITGIDTEGPVSTVSRSDVNMIMTVNMNNHKILLTSIPRDYYVTLATKGAKDKLTHSGIYGVSETVKTLENLLDIDIDYYVRINFTSLIKIVDVLGGVDVTSDRDLYAQGIHISKGVNHMDGKTALAYSRERHSYAEGDRHRIQNQQDVIMAIIKKLSSSAILTNYQELMQKLSGTFETNMSSDDISSVINMQLNSMQGFTMENQYLNGTGTKMKGLYSMPNSNLYTMIPDQSTVDSASEAIKALESEE